MLFKLSKSNINSENILPTDQLISKTLNNDSQKVENELLKDYIKNIYERMETIIHKHGLVNEQHDEIALLANEIKNTVQEVKNISNESNNLASHLSNKSNNLNSISEDSVQKSLEGRNAAKGLAKVMSDLQSQSNTSSDSMLRLEERSKEITNIIKTITDIAKQTNLLALNAAIEAARAGEHGRGFAVVADEVRKLAEMTTSSTSSIQSLVTNIQNEIGIAFDNNQKSTGAIKDGIHMSEIVNDKIKDMVQGFEAVQIEVKEVTQTITTQKKHIGDILNQTQLSDHILANMHEKLISHVDRAFVVDKSLEENLVQIKTMLK